MQFSKLAPHRLAFEKSDPEKSAPQSFSAPKIGKFKRFSGEDSLTFVVSFNKRLRCHASALTRPRQPSLPPVEKPDQARLCKVCRAIRRWPRALAASPHVRAVRESDSTVRPVSRPSRSGYSHWCLRHASGIAADTECFERRQYKAFQVVPHRNCPVLSAAFVADRLRRATGLGSPLRDAMLTPARNCSCRDRTKVHSWFECARRSGRGGTPRLVGLRSVASRVMRRHRRPGRTKAATCLHRRLSATRRFCERPFSRSESGKRRCPEVRPVEGRAGR